MSDQEQTSAAVKATIQKLQRAIVDGLQDVKAQDIQVFNTEHLSPLFERVIIASGSSNRQTRALAVSVRDAVGKAGFPKPRMEGEENGEWIIVDCGAAVAHIMQPAIRQYYTLEDIWGGKPVRMSMGAKTAAKASTKKSPAQKPAAKTAAKTASKTTVKTSAKTTAAPKTASKTAVKKTAVKKAATKKA